MDEPRERPANERLIEALKKYGAPDEMIMKAEKDYYHEMRSPMPTPLILLAHDAAQARLPQEFHIELVDGHFDAAGWEIDEWMQSDEGKAACDELMRGHDEASSDN